MVISSSSGTNTAMLKPYSGPNNSEQRMMSESLTSSVKKPTGIFTKYIQAYAKAQNIAVAAIFLIFSVEVLFGHIIKNPPFGKNGRIGTGKTPVLLLFSSGLSFRHKSKLSFG